MPAIRVTVDFGLGETAAPFGQEMFVKDEIQLSPADQHRQTLELTDSLGDRTD